MFVVLLSDPGGLVALCLEAVGADSYARSNDHTPSAVTHPAMMSIE